MFRKNEKQIRSGDVGKRIATANARIHVDYVAAVLGEKRVTVQNPNMAQLLADQLAIPLGSSLAVTA